MPHHFGLKDSICGSFPTGDLCTFNRLFGELDLEGKKKHQQGLKLADSANAAFLKFRGSGSHVVFPEQAAIPRGFWTQWKSVFRATGREPLKHLCLRLETCLFAEHAGKAASPRALPASSSHTPSAWPSGARGTSKLARRAHVRARCTQLKAPKSSRAAQEHLHHFQIDKNLLVISLDCPRLFILINLKPLFHPD